MASRELEQAVRRFADHQSARLSDIPASPLFFATVTVTAPLTVEWRGSALPARSHGASYTPTVADRVLCALVSSQVIVIDKMTP